jgi:hypothetical protein
MMDGSYPKPQGRKQNITWLLSEDAAEVVSRAGYNPEWAMPRLACMVARYRAGETVMQPTAAAMTSVA